MIPAKCWAANKTGDKTRASADFAIVHNPRPARAGARCWKNDTCARFILTRNPVESYVSWKDRARTGQWKLLTSQAHKKAQAVFERGRVLVTILKGTLQEFQLTLLNPASKAGADGFYVASKGPQSVEVDERFGPYLGVDHQLDATGQSLEKAENPEPISPKVKQL